MTEQLHIADPLAQDILPAAEGDTDLAEEGTVLADPVIRNCVSDCLM